MPASSWPVSLALLVAITYPALADASPRPLRREQGARMSLPLQRRSPSPKTVEEWGSWAKSHRESMQMKYGYSDRSRRSSGTNLIVNQNADSSFFGTLALGTPPTAFNVILDTGSSDLWVADSNCNASCGGVPTFDADSSSTFTTNNQPFNIAYGSGQAAGFLGSDTVQMAGFSVANQTFAICDQVSNGLLTAPVSGLLGLAFGSIASSKSTPFWQTLAAGGTWDEPLMAFQLTRFVNVSGAEKLEPGGAFNMGFTNQSLYTGDIEYQDLVTTPSYWLLSLTQLTVNGQQVSVPSGSSAYSAIDTGTTLVGGPQEYVSAIYDQIPGAAPATGNFQGYYTYPCDTSVNVTMAFGGRSWPISPADFRLTALTRSQCLGAFFDLTTGRSAPSWIVGDTFLKNVYSVFRYDPASVGFAQLSDVALSQNGRNAPVPTPTIGSAATVTATGPVSGNSAVFISIPSCSTFALWTLLSFVLAFVPV